MKVVSVLNKISEKAGGVTRMATYRTDSFIKLGIDATVATLALDNNLYQTINNLISSSYISDKFKAINFYSSLSYSHKHNIDLSEVFLSYHKESLAEKVTKVRINPRNSKSTLIQYFNSSDELFLEEYLNSKKVCTCILYHHPKKGRLQFSSKHSVHAYWLSELKGSSECYYIADAVRLAKSVCMINGHNAYKILMAHGNHLLMPRTIGSRLNPIYQDAFNFNGLADAFVLLTRHQREDIEAQFNVDIKKFHVIPNPIKAVNLNDLSESSDGLAMTLSRLHSVKQIDKIINAFSSIVSENDNVILEIWGEGDERENLEALVRKKQLEKNIKFKGFSENPHRQLSRATVALSMSSAEGFGVSIAEALSCGTPVVSTRTKYGPTDIISNGHDGFSVDNETEFIEKVSYLLNNPEVARKMGKAGIVSSSRFKSNQIIDKWLDLFSELKKAKEYGFKYDSQGAVINNSSGSKVGWVYLDNDIDKAEAIEDSGSIFIKKVDKKLSFGGVCELESQVYDIEKVSFDTKKEVYRFRVLSKGEVYKGPIPAKCIEFTILK